MSRNPQTCQKGRDPSPTPEPLAQKPQNPEHLEGRNPGHLIASRWWADEAPEGCHSVAVTPRGPIPVLQAGSTPAPPDSPASPASGNTNPHSPCPPKMGSQEPRSGLGLPQKLRAPVTAVRGARPPQCQEGQKPRAHMGGICRLPRSGDGGSLEGSKW